MESAGDRESSHSRRAHRLDPPGAYHHRAGQVSPVSAVRSIRRAQVGPPAQRSDRGARSAPRRKHRDPKGLEPVGKGSRADGRTPRARHRDDAAAAGDVGCARPHAYRTDHAHDGAGVQAGSRAVDGVFSRAAGLTETAPWRYLPAILKSCSRTILVGTATRFSTRSLPSVITASATGASRVNPQITYDPSAAVRTSTRRLCFVETSLPFSSTQSTCQVAATCASATGFPDSSRT